MSYTPNNTPVYLRAYAGYLAGITAASVSDTSQADYTLYTQTADAWAQAVDTVFSVGAPTNFELEAIQENSESIWRGRSPLASAAGVLPGSYLQIAQSLVARVVQGNAQIVAEGIDPNNTGGGAEGGTVTRVTAASPLVATPGLAGATTYNVALNLAPALFSAGVVSLLQAVAGEMFSPGVIIATARYTPTTTGRVRFYAILNGQASAVDAVTLAAVIWTAAAVDGGGTVGGGVRYRQVTPVTLTGGALVSVPAEGQGVVVNTGTAFFLGGCVAAGEIQLTPGVQNVWEFIAVGANASINYTFMNCNLYIAEVP